MAREDEGSWGAHLGKTYALLFRLVVSKIDLNEFEEERLFFLVLSLEQTEEEEAVFVTVTGTEGIIVSGDRGVLLLIQRNVC